MRRSSRASHQITCWSTRSRKDGGLYVSSLGLRFLRSRSPTSMTPRSFEGESGECAYSWSLRSPSASLWQGSFYCTWACASDTETCSRSDGIITRLSKIPVSFKEAACA